jgi:hypothetical protein
MSNNIIEIKDYSEAVNRIKSAREEDRELAIQIVNLMSAQDMTSCNAKIVLSLCHDLIEINSKITPVK